MDFPPYANPSYVMPGQINVTALLDDGTKSTFEVKIEKLPPEASKVGSLQSADFDGWVDWICPAM